MITWLNFFKNSLLIRFELMEVDQKWVFMITWFKKWPKTHFWSTFNSPNWIKIKFESGSKVGFRTNWVTWSLISKRNLGGSKLSWGAYASRDSHPSHTLLDQNLDPKKDFLLRYVIIDLFFMITFHVMSSFIALQVGFWT